MGDYADGKPYGGHQAHNLIVQADERRKAQQLDPAHTCTVCKEAWVDSDNGFDTCAACLATI